MTAFRFLCPRGHVLQAEESLSGTACTCPQCGVAFLIPRPAAEETGDTGDTADYGAAEESEYPDFSQMQPRSRNDPIARLQEEPPADDADEAEAEPADEEEADALEPGSSAVEIDHERSMLHIPCPAGHVLETPREMLGQEVLCPFCQQKFYPRWERSTEYQQSKAQAEERFEQHRGRMWITWAVAAAVVVLLGLLALLVALTRT